LGSGLSLRLSFWDIYCKKELMQTRVYVKRAYVKRAYVKRAYVKKSLCKKEFM